MIYVLTHPDVYLAFSPKAKSEKGLRRLAMDNALFDQQGALDANLQCRQVWPTLYSRIGSFTEATWRDCLIIQHVQAVLRFRTSVLCNASGNI